MNLKNNIKLNFSYPDLKKLNVDKDLLNEALSDPKFGKLYKKDVKNFIKYLEDYTYDIVGVGKETYGKLDKDTISNHLNCLLKTYKDYNTSYINTIKEKGLENYKITNPEILNDPNFAKLYEVMQGNVFNDNVVDIIKRGYSDRLLQFILSNHLNNSKLFANLNYKLFTDKSWNIINTSNNEIINKLYNSNLELLLEIIDKDYLEGLIFTYNNIQESRHFIDFCLSSNNLDVFDIDFINRIDLNVLKKIYGRYCLENKEEYAKILKIIQSDNIELLEDIINFDVYNTFKFNDLKDEDVSKNIVDIKTVNLAKSELVAFKYLGIAREDNYYLKLFLDAINKVELSSDFKDKYGSIINLLNKVYYGSEEEIQKIVSDLDINKKEEYKKLIYACEQAGDDFIRGTFSSDLKERDDLLKSNTDNYLLPNTSIPVYELKGSPFTFLVHSINYDIVNLGNKDAARKIASDFSNWNKLDANKHISTSLISNEYMIGYGTPDNDGCVMFGFSNVPANSIKLTSTHDVGIDRDAGLDTNYDMRNRAYETRENTVLTVDDLMQKTIKFSAPARDWNEVVLSRVDENTNKRIQPDYIVCMDYISETSKKAAEYFNVPIYLIDRKYYQSIDKVMNFDELNNSEKRR